MVLLFVRYLIPCTHVMVSQRRAVKDVDMYSKTAEKLLTLKPACCTSDYQENPTDSSATTPASSHTASASTSRWATQPVVSVSVSVSSPYLYPYMYSYPYPCIHFFIHIHMRIDYRVCIHVHSCIHSRIHICIHMHIHIYIHRQQRGGGEMGRMKSVLSCFCHTLSFSFEWNMFKPSGTSVLLVSVIWFKHILYKRKGFGFGIKQLFA